MPADSLSAHFGFNLINLKYLSAKKKVCETLFKGVLQTQPHSIAVNISVQGLTPPPNLYYIQPVRNVKRQKE